MKKLAYIEDKSGGLEGLGIAGRYQIRVWGWPTLIFYVLFMLLLLGLKLTASSSEHFLEPESGREVVFTLILGSLFVSYLWILVFRYSMYCQKKLSRITKAGVIFLTAAFVIGTLCSVFLYVKKISGS